MKEIELTQGKKTIVDDVDYEEFSKQKWGFSQNGACRRSPPGSDKVRVYMHRQICKADESEVVEHVDGNKLNNVRSNLRKRSRTNLAQKRVARSASGYKGVYFYHEKWCVQLTAHGKRVSLGSFTDKIEAAQAYDAEARRVHGPSAYLNFGPDSPHYVAPKADLSDAV